MAVMYWIQKAKRILPQLIKNAAAGQIVIICRGKVPVAQLLAIKRPQAPKTGNAEGHPYSETGCLRPSNGQRTEDTRAEMSP
jgi:antitoxin (DNA-binding transcriptional repressor) of toxin-antitoxin stability system